MASRHISNLCSGVLLGTLLTFGSTASADELQNMDCAWWSIVTEHVYENYAIMVESDVEDPIAALKLSLDYVDYHALSAGREMLDLAFAGLETGNPLWLAREQVWTLCHGFPAKAVHPLNVYAPALGVEA